MSSVGYGYMSAAVVSLITVSHLSLVSASTPDWCKWCLEDDLPTDRCLDYKTRLNWCVSGYPMTMREKCSRTCGYCDGCPAGTAEANQHAKDSAPTRQPTPFTGTGENCRPDRKFTGDTDFRTACSTWKGMGYCDTHQDLMHRDCADTCGLCTHPEGARAQQPAPRPAPASQPSPVPASEPISRKKDTIAESTSDVGGCTCDRYGSDGAACNAAIGCEWSWAESKCIPIEGTCESIRSDGPTCTATIGCEWDWEHNCCVTGEDLAESSSSCQRIGSNGMECSKTDGCRWDWDRSICVDSEDNTSRGVTSANGFNKTGKNKNQKGRRGGKRGGKLGKESKPANGIGATNPCAKLKGKRCTRNASCYLDGKVCLQNGGSSVACERLSRKLCKGSCRFDKATRTCTAL